MRISSISFISIFIFQIRLILNYIPEAHEYQTYFDIMKVEHI